MDEYFRGEHPTPGEMRVRMLFLMKKCGVASYCLCVFVPEGVYAGLLFLCVFVLLLVVVLVVVVLVVVGGAVCVVVLLFFLRKEGVHMCCCF